MGFIVLVAAILLALLLAKWLGVWRFALDDENVYRLVNLLMRWTGIWR